jgi:hypothetical protein
MGPAFLKAVQALKALSARHQVMALYSSLEWSPAYLEEQLRDCDQHTSPLSMVLDEPPPEITGAHVEPDKVLN